MYMPVLLKTQETKLKNHFTLKGPVHGRPTAADPAGLSPLSLVCLLGQAGYECSMRSVRLVGGVDVNHGSLVHVLGQ